MAVLQRGTTKLSSLDYYPLGLRLALVFMQSIPVLAETWQHGRIIGRHFFDIAV